MKLEKEAYFLFVFDCFWEGCHQISSYGNRIDCLSIIQQAVQNWDNCGANLSKYFCFYGIYYKGSSINHVQGFLPCIATIQVGSVIVQLETVEPSKFESIRV